MKITITPIVTYQVKYDDKSLGEFFLDESVATAHRLRNVNSEELLVITEKEQGHVAVEPSDILGEGAYEVYKASPSIVNSVSRPKLKVVPIR
ncbi:MAG: hypothetical protein V3V31_07250 [Methylococcales bacterium]